jgi:hypothetical protein
MFGGGAAPIVDPVVFQSANLLVSTDGEIPLASAGAGDSPAVPARAATTPSGALDAGVNADPAQGETGSSEMVQSYDPFWGNLAGPPVPASGTTWTNASTGAAYDSGAVTAGLESRFGAGTARMLTVLYDQFGPQAYNDYVSQHPNIDFSKLNFATLPPMTAFQMYGPGDSFADPNNQNQYCYFDESGVEHLSGAGSIGQA